MAQGSVSVLSPSAAARETTMMAAAVIRGPRQVNRQAGNWKGLDVINAHERDPRIYIEGRREAVEATRGACFPCGNC